MRNNPLATWVADDVNLAKDRLVGPFDFVAVPPNPNARNVRRKAAKFSQLVDLSFWDQLVTIGKQRGLDVSEVDATPDRQIQRPP